MTVLIDPGGYKYLFLCKVLKPSCICFGAAYRIFHSNITQLFDGVSINACIVQATSYTSPGFSSLLNMVSHHLSSLSNAARHNSLLPLGHQRLHVNGQTRTE